MDVNIVPNHVDKPSNVVLTVFLCVLEWIIDNFKIQNGGRMYEVIPSFCNKTFIKPREPAGSWKKTTFLQQK
ncbi:hypothetical protein L2E82_25268 [Cichorium intybus]|uniref:Uncharacterized protein n=1 Tax=Cichorium intybus TaxID=13427 RepID=A0ACB9E428_CICIN|nr:hypothetical protein L2E82_25268 [Cichorium intybus]